MTLPVKLSKKLSRYKFCDVCVGAPTAPDLIDLVYEISGLTSD